MTVLGLLILALFVSCCAAMLYDVDCAIHDALLEELWEDE